MLRIGVLMAKNGGRRPPMPPLFKGRWSKWHRLVLNDRQSSQMRLPCPARGTVGRAEQASEPVDDHPRPGGAGGRAAGACLAGDDERRIGRDERPLQLDVARIVVER